MALKAGFFNAMSVNGDYDRKYNADDYSNIFSAYISDGVRRSGLDDMKVSADGLTISVTKGYAVCGGRWVHLDADMTLTTISPPVGDYSRLDAVVLRMDANEATRAASLVYRQGTAASTPVAPSKDTTTGVTELILAHITVTPSATAVRVRDTRSNADLCGWVTTPVGYDDYFKSLDVAFEDWFAEIKDELASVTLFKEYQWRTVLDSASSYVVFDIPQYDGTGTDILNVYVNGLRETEGIDYTLSNSTITFGTAGGGSGTKVAGTEIVVVCYKSIDGTGLGSVSDEITAMQNQVAALQKDTSYNYICTGTDDNAALSELVQSAVDGIGVFADLPANAEIKIDVYGDFGATTPVSGTGTSSSYYRWFNIGSAASDTRRITVDFSHCSAINIEMSGNTYNTLFYGANCHVRGLNIKAICTELECQCYAFGATSGEVTAEDSCFEIVTTGLAMLSRTGTFINCRAYISSANGNAFCFQLNSDAKNITVIGGSYRAYCASGANINAVVYSDSSQPNAVCILCGVSCPTVAVTNFYQTHALRINSGYISCFGLVSALSIATASAATASITGTVPLSK